jgi:hypothetical protein
VGGGWLEIRYCEHLGTCAPLTGQVNVQRDHERLKMYLI